MTAAEEAKMINPELVKKDKKILYKDVNSDTQNFKWKSANPNSDPDAFIRVAFDYFPEIHGNEKNGNEYSTNLDCDINF